MLKRNKRFISKLAILAVCTSLVSNTIAFGDVSETVGSVTGVDSTTTTGEVASPETDFTFDAATGTITKYVGTSTTVVIPSTINGVAVKNIGNNAFITNLLTSVTIPEGIISIQDYAFINCSKLTSITIPSSVENLGPGFAGGLNLQSINVNENNNNYTSVDGVLFNKSKTQIVSYPRGKTNPSYIIPDSVTSIGALAFNLNKNLTSIKIPSTVTSIGDGAFSYCTNLVSIEIPSTVTSIGNQAFRYCSGLSSLEIPSGVTTIGNYTFFNCNKMINIVLPSTITSIGEGAFSTCSSLTEINIPSTVTSIGSSAFESCDSLTGIEIPSAVTKIEPSTFSHCDKLATIKMPSSITSIGEEAFINCISLVNVEIPSGVTSIVDDLFTGCNNLQSVTIPSGVTSISDRAFMFCNKLASIVVDSDNSNYASVDGILFNKSQTEIVRYPQGKQATNYVIPNTVTSVASGAFYNCSKLLDLTIPDSVTTIGSSAFAYCTNLIGIKIPSSVTVIPKCAFWNCWNLAGVSIPSTVIRIEESAFAYSGIKSLMIPSSVTYLGPYTLSSCSRLTSVTIPDSITSIETGTFLSCRALTSITIPSSVTSIGTAAFSCTGLTNVTIPAGVTNIADRTFEACYKLSSVTLPGGITNIGAGAFESCYELSRITVPDSLTAIGTNAFNSCDSILFYAQGDEAKQFLISNGIADSKIILSNELSLTLNNTSLSLIPGSVAALEATVAPSNVPNKVVWESSNTNVATVDASGIVKSTGLGTAVITCTLADGSGKTATCVVTGEAYTKESASEVKIALAAYTIEGYCWDYIDSQSGVVDLISRTNVSNPTAGYIATDGVDVWTFRGLKQWSTILNFQCLRSGETIPTYTKAFLLTVDRELKVTIKEIAEVSGDVNGDGTVNSLDFAVMKKYLLGATISPVIQNSDINKDGKVNALDYALLRQRILK